MTDIKKALITGVTGQDGSYLAELLLAKGYEVHGLVRRSSSFNTERIEGIYQDPHASNYRLRLVYGDLEDGSALANLVKNIQPDEIYNLAAQSHVRVSFDVPEYTVSSVALGTLRLLEAMWLMLQQDAADDYVIATGESHSVRECLEVAFGTLGLDWKRHVEIDPRYFRPTEVDHLHGDASKARAKLGWKPKVHFRELIEMMVKADEADVRGALAGRAPRM